MYNFESNFFNIKLTEVLYRYNANSVYHENSRRADGLIYYTKGGHIFNFDEFSLETEAGELLYIPYGEKYTNKIKVKYTEYYQIDFVLYDGENPVRLFDKATLFSRECADRVLPYVKRAYDKYADADVSSRLFCISDVVKILGITECEKNSQQNETNGMEKIRNTISYISEHYTLNTSVGELAAMSNMCVSNLEKLFRKNFGMSPIAYRNKLRIERAKNLIRGGFTVSEAANMSGFSDYFYFVRMFKKYEGYTPGTLKDEITGV